MTSQKIESEVRFSVPNLQTVQSSLAHAGAKKTDTSLQIDTYYKEKGREREPDVPGSVIYRKRKRGEQAAFDVTRKVTSDVPGTWIETETRGLPENFECVFDEIIARGFSSVLIISKRRVTYDLNGFEVCVDEIDGLGSFVEIEALNSKDAPSDLASVAATLGLDWDERIEKGYVTLMKEKQNLEEQS